MTEFKWIGNYEGLYKIGRDGTVVSMQNRSRKRLAQNLSKLTPWSNGKNYQVVSLVKNRRKKNHYVHRLVAAHFLKNPGKGYEVAHKNGDRSDNRVENLKWATHAENEKDKLLHGTLLRGEKANWAKLNNEKVQFIKKALSYGMQKTIIAKTFGVTPSAIKAIEIGRNWAHINNQ